MMDSSNNDGSIHDEQRNLAGRMEGAETSTGQRLIMVWYPAELIGYEDGTRRYRWVEIDASSALEPKVCF